MSQPAESVDTPPEVALRGYWAGPPISAPILLLVASLRFSGAVCSFDSGGTRPS